MIGLLLLLACSPAVTTAAPVAGLPAAAQAAYDGCADYRDVPAAHEVCLSKAVHALDTADEVDALCRHAGASEPTCRRAWAANPVRIDTAPRDELLRVCAADADCAFQVLDAQPAPGPIEQVRLCERHVAAFLRDCAGHSIQRWLATAPSEAEIADVYAALPAHLDTLTWLIGHADACGGKVRCGAGEGPADTMCRARAEDQRRRGCR